MRAVRTLSPLAVKLGIEAEAKMRARQCLETYLRAVNLTNRIPTPAEIADAYSQMYRHYLPIVRKGWEHAPR